MNQASDTLDLLRLKIVKNDLCFVANGYSGVGAGLNPPQYLVPGTQMDVFISEIGTLRNKVAFA